MDTRDKLLVSYRGAGVGQVRLKNWELLLDRQEMPLEWQEMLTFNNSRKTEETAESAVFGVSWELIVSAPKATSHCFQCSASQHVNTTANLTSLPSPLSQSLAVGEHSHRGLNTWPKGRLACHGYDPGCQHTINLCTNTNNLRVPQQWSKNPLIPPPVVGFSVGLKLLHLNDIK